jgi:hypothetical protein
MGHPEPETESFDPRSRRLCRDGSCIGVIGADGQCKLCGLADGGGPLATAPAAPWPEEPQDEDDEAHEDARVAGAEDGGGAGFDPARKLCVDGSCIGVIGPDGRCTECGRTGEA